MYARRILRGSKSVVSLVSQAWEGVGAMVTTDSLFICRLAVYAEELVVTGLPHCGTRGCLGTVLGG